MFNNHLSPTLLDVLGGCLFGLALVLAADPICAYGWAALAAYVGLQLAAPLARRLMAEDADAEISAPRAQEGGAL